MVPKTWPALPRLLLFHGAFQCSLFASPKSRQLQEKLRSPWDTQPHPCPTEVPWRERLFPDRGENKAIGKHPAGSRALVKHSWGFPAPSVEQRFRKDPSWMRQTDGGSSCTTETAFLPVGKDPGIMLGSDFSGISHPGPAQGLGKVLSQGLEQIQRDLGFIVQQSGGESSLSSFVLLNWSPPCAAVPRTWSTSSWLCQLLTRHSSTAWQGIPSPAHLSVLVATTILGSLQILVFLPEKWWKTSSPSVIR